MPLVETRKKITVNDERERALELFVRTNIILLIYFRIEYIFFGGEIERAHYLFPFRRYIATQCVHECIIQFQRYAGMFFRPSDLRARISHHTLQVSLSLSGSPAFDFRYRTFPVLEPKDFTAQIYTHRS